MAVPAWVKAVTSAALALLAATLLVAVAFNESGSGSWRPDELIVGGGFLGDLP